MPTYNGALVLRGLCLALFFFFWHINTVTCDVPQWNDRKVLEKNDEHIISKENCVTSLSEMV